MECLRAADACTRISSLTLQGGAQSQQRGGLPLRPPVCWRDQCDASTRSAWTRELSRARQHGFGVVRAVAGEDVAVSEKAEATTSESRRDAAGEGSSEEEYGVVEKILASRVVDGQTEYLVRWTDDFGDSWEPADNLADDIKDVYDSPWWQAARKGDMEKLQDLLNQEGRDVNAIDPNKRTVLHFLSGIGNEGAVRLLIQCGADVHAQDKEGYTALHIAAGYVHTPVVRVLLEFGADPEAPDKNGRTVLELAQELLQKMPANNPMVFAKRLAMNEVVKMLDDAIFEDVEVEQVLDRRVVAEGQVEYLVRWSDGSEESWEPSENIADDLIKDYEEGLEYGEVEAVLDKRKRKGKVEYLVKWTDSDENSWEPAENLAEEVVEEYEATHKGKDDGKSKAGAAQ